MKVAYYYNGFPNKYAVDFCKYLPASVTILHNECTKDVDLIYCGSSDARGCLSAAFKAKRSIAPRAPLVCYVWDLPFEISGLNYLAQMNLNLLKVCDHVVAASVATYNILVKSHVSSLHQIYFYPPDIEMLQERSGHPLKVNQVIHVGRFVPHKHHEMCIAAMKNIPTYSLVCVGSGAKDVGYFESLLQLTGDNVRILHNISRADLLDEIRKSRLLVSCSSFEGLGLPPIEAALLGTPVALRKIPVFQEVYQSSVPYFTDADDLYDVIDEIISTPGYETSLVEAARRRVKDFTPQKFAEKWLSLMEKFCSDVK